MRRFSIKILFFFSVIFFSGNFFLRSFFEGFSGFGFCFYGFEVLSSKSSSISSSWSFMVVSGL